MNRRGPIEVLIHWLFVTEAIVLTATGLYLHSPITGVPYGIELFLHVSSGYAILPTVGLRVYWALYGGGEHRVSWRGVAGNVGAAVRQYWVYALLWVCLGAQMILGYSLISPSTGFGARVMQLLGGMATAGVVHYLLMWAFIGALALHVYRAMLAGRSGFLDMFVPRRAGSEAPPTDAAEGRVDLS